MTDSNQDIKNRLSERVRDNAMHLLDPHRKVDGQPVPAQQPELLTGGIMKLYQIEGIEWLRVSHCFINMDLCHMIMLCFYFFYFLVQHFFFHPSTCDSYDKREKKRDFFFLIVI